MNTYKRLVKEAVEAIGMITDPVSKVASIGIILDHVKNLEEYVFENEKNEAEKISKNEVPVNEVTKDQKEEKVAEPQMTAEKAAKVIEESVVDPEKIEIPEPKENETAEETKTRRYLLSKKYGDLTLAQVLVDSDKNKYFTNDMYIISKLNESIINYEGGNFDFNNAKERVLQFMKDPSISPNLEKNIDMKVEVFLMKFCPFAEQLVELYSYTKKEVNSAINDMGFTPYKDLGVDAVNFNNISGVLCVLRETRTAA